MGGTCLEIEVIKTRFATARRHTLYTLLTLIDSWSEFNRKIHYTITVFYELVGPKKKKKKEKR